MPVFVIEISGTGVLAFNESSRTEAEKFAASEELREDLTVLEHDGKPLWDGSSPVVVRGASTEEEARWNAAQTETEKTGDPDDDDEIWVEFLVPVVDPSDGDDDSA